MLSPAVGAPEREPARALLSAAAMLSTLLVLLVAQVPPDSPPDHAAATPHAAVFLQPLGTSLAGPVAGALYVSGGAAVPLSPSVELVVDSGLFQTHVEDGVNTLWQLWLGIGPMFHRPLDRGRGGTFFFRPKLGLFTARHLSGSRLAPERGDAYGATLGAELGYLLRFEHVYVSMHLGGGLGLARSSVFLPIVGEGGVVPLQVRPHADLDLNFIRLGYVF
jgi:hypothetical protein